MALTPRFLLILFSLLPLAAHAQTSQGPSSSSAPAAAAPAAAAPSPVSPVQAPVITNRPAAAPAGRPTAATPTQATPGQAAPVIRLGGPTAAPGTTATAPANAQAQPATIQTDPQTQFQTQAPGFVNINERNEFQDFVAQSTGQVLPLFGYNLFQGAPSTFAPVDSIPVTADYVIGPGDSIVIRAWGQLDVDYTVTVDRNGQISIPKVGTVSVAGLRFQDLDGFLKTAIGRNFRNFDLNVTMGALRSVQVFVVGQAARPGVYTVSSLSTLVSALFASGGPSPKGSMRRIQLKRGIQTVAEFDMYDLLVNGDKSKDTRLLPGDVIYIPPVGQLAALLGSVNTQAIFELKDTTSFEDLIKLAGGFTTTAQGQKAIVERIFERAVRRVDEFALDKAGLARKLQDGDVITIAQITPRFDNAVRLQGNVAAAARYPWRQGMRITDLLIDQNALITTAYWQRQNIGTSYTNYNRREVNFDYATIQRLDRKDLVTRLYAFNLGKAIAGDTRENVVLQPGDVVSVYSFEDPLPRTENDVVLQGSVIGGEQRRFAWREGMRLRDLIPSAQWLIDYYSYWLNTSGALGRNVPGTNLNEVTARNQATFSPGSVININEVTARNQGNLNPGSIIGSNEINWDYANVERLQPADLTRTLVPFDLGKAVLAGDPGQNLLLTPGDIVTIFSKATFGVPLERRTNLVVLEDEFRRPGIYKAEPGETLRQLVVRTGGVTPNAYLFGAVFTRESTRIAQQKSLDEAINRLELDAQRNLATKAQSGLATDTESITQQAAAQQAVITRLRQLRASGRIILKQSGVTQLADIPDLPLENGDRLQVPFPPSTVSVFGAVYNEGSFVYKPDQRVTDYLVQSGGPTRTADAGAIYVLRADGSVISKRQSGWITGSFESERLMPGDAIVVPEDFEHVSWTKTLKDWGQILYQFGLGAAAIKVLKN